MGRLCPAHGKLKCRKCKGRITIADIQAAAERSTRRHSARLVREIYTCLPPGDCPLFGCQLSAGHPPPHCLLVAGGRYQMVDDHGRILREL